MRTIDLLLILAWGFALFNAGRALATTPIDWLGFAISAVAIIAAPIIGIATSRDRV